MKQSLIIMLGIAILLISCQQDEPNPLMGTVLKKISLKDKSGTYLINQEFVYDDQGRLESITDHNNFEWSQLDVKINYSNGRVSWVNSDSLVYENNHLSKSFYVDEDTMFITNEFIFENELLKEKISYIRRISSWSTLNYSNTIDTTHYYFQYDDQFNCIKTSRNRASRFYLFVNTWDNSINIEGDYQYDHQVSPYTGFANEIKYMLGLNPGSNNLIAVHSATTPIPFNIENTYTYNLDGLPLKKTVKNAINEQPIVYSYY